MRSATATSLTSVKFVTAVKLVIDSASAPVGLISTFNCCIASAKINCLSSSSFRILARSTSLSKPIRLFNSLSSPSVTIEYVLFVIRPSAESISLCACVNCAWLVSSLSVTVSVSAVTVPSRASISIAAVLATAMVSLFNNDTRVASSEINESKPFKVVSTFENVTPVLA